jgi:MFS family permease
VPLQGSYSAAVALVLLALCPFLVLSAASQLFDKQLAAELGGGELGTQLASGLSNAGYAFGAVLSADLIQRFPGRRIFLACEAGFVVGSLLAGLAPEIVVFIAGRVVQGLVTGMMLVVALPPLATGHGVRKLPLTAAFVSLGLFGAVTLGPVVGGIVGTASAWRPLFFGAAALGVLGFLNGVLAFRRGGSAGPGAHFDWSAVPVAAAATVLPFLGVSLLSEGSFASLGFILPVVLGLLALGTLLVRQYRKPRALMPIRLVANTLPVTGISVAMAAGAAYTTLIELTVVYLLQVADRSAIVAGALLATQLAGIITSSWLFKATLPSRWLPALAFAGLLLVTAGGAILLGLGSGHDLLVVTTAGVLLGFGAGAGVTPALFMAGLSVPSNRLGPAFALVELLRSEAAFLVGPVLLSIALAAGNLADGVRLSIFITMGIAVVAGIASGAVLLLGRVRPHAPDLDRWLSGQAPAYRSPPVAAAIRTRSRKQSN